MTAHALLSATKPWHDETTRLRAMKMPVAEIARKVGVSESSVTWFLNENGYRERESLRKQSTRRRDYLGMPHDVGIASRAPRKIQQAISQDAKMEAVRAFATGAISRDELMRRITPRDKWRGKSWEEA